MRNRIIAVAVAAVSMVVAIAIAMAATPTDFLDFYCQAATVNGGHDPYLVEPLRTCEHRFYPGGLLAGIVIPAVLPAYATVPFRLLALLPFDVARTIFTLGEIVSVAATLVVLRRLTNAPLLALAGVFVVAGLYVSMLTGQIATFSIAAAALCADALARERYRSAAVWSIFAMVEPHLGLPILLTLALAVPKIRVPLLAGVTLLGVLTLVSPHAGYPIEYFSGVLPGQLRSELHLGGQIGTAHLLTMIGVADGVALRLASLGYIVATALTAVVLARSGAKGRPLLVAGPLAISIAAAPYGHVTQCCAAIPALVIICARAENLVMRTVAALALAVLAVPIITFGPNQTSPPLAVGFAIVTAICAASIARLPWRPAALVGTVNAAFIYGITVQLVADPAPSRALVARLLEVPPTALGQTLWQIYVEPLLTASGPASTLAKLGTWAALYATVAMSIAWCVVRTSDDPASRGPAPTARDAI